MIKKFNSVVLGGLVIKGFNSVVLGGLVIKGFNSALLGGLTVLLTLQHTSSCRRSKSPLIASNCHHPRQGSW